MTVPKYIVRKSFILDGGDTQGIMADFNVTTVSEAQLLDLFGVSSDAVYTRLQPDWSNIWSVTFVIPFHLYGGGLPKPDPNTEKLKGLMCKILSVDTA